MIYQLCSGELKTYDGKVTSAANAPFKLRKTKWLQFFISKVTFISFNVTP